MGCMPVEGMDSLRPDSKSEFQGTIAASVGGGSTRCLPSLIVSVEWGAESESQNCRGAAASATWLQRLPAACSLRYLAAASASCLQRTLPGCSVCQLPAADATWLQRLPAACSLRQLAAAFASCLQRTLPGCSICQLPAADATWLQRLPAACSGRYLAAASASWLQPPLPGCTLRRLAAAQQVTWVSPLVPDVDDARCRRRKMKATWTGKGVRSGEEDPSSLLAGWQGKTTEKQGTEARRLIRSLDQRSAPTCMAAASPCCTDGEREARGRG
eukprot:363798-Chlamydomonas_euryale.AAC.5